MPGWLYHGEPWLTAIRDSLGADIFGLLTETNAGEAVALTPVMHIRRGLFRLAGSPLRGMYTEFSGPLFAPGTEERIKQEALVSQHAHLRQQGVNYIEWGEKGGTVNSYMDILRSEGYEYVPRKTLVIDIGQGIDKVWNRFEGRARNMVRKSEKSGVIARSILPNSNDVINYYDMLVETFRRQGAHAPHPLSFFKSICERLIPAGQLKFIIAENEGRVVAGGIFPCSGERMAYLSGTSTEEGMRLAANSLIQWVAMQQAADSGVTEYDLGGVGNAAIDKFKISFGGQLFTHHRWVYRPWAIKLAETGYKWLAEKGWARLHG